MHAKASLVGFLLPLPFIFYLLFKLMAYCTINCDRGIHLAMIILLAIIVAVISSFIMIFDDRLTIGNNSMIINAIKFIIYIGYITLLLLVNKDIQNHYDLSTSGSIGLVSIISIMCLSIILRETFIEYQIDNSQPNEETALSTFTVNITNEQVIPTNESCSICLESYSEVKPGIKIECNHIFHKECIVEWLINNETCPLCRQNII